MERDVQEGTCERERRDTKQRARLVVAVHPEDTAAIVCTVQTRHSMLQSVQQTAELDRSQAGTEKQLQS